MSFQIDKKDRKYQFVILCYFIYFFSCMLRNSTPRFVCPSVRQLFGQSVGWSVGWLVGWSVGWSVGWLVSYVNGNAPKLNTGSHQSYYRRGLVKKYLLQIFRPLG